MQTLRNRTLFSLLILSVLVVTPFSSHAADISTPEQLVIKSEMVYKSFMVDTHMEWFRNNVGKAEGIFVVPQMLRGGFIIGGSGGSGVLLSRDFKTGEWSYPAFYTMGSVSFGLQIGADTSEIILMIMTDKGMKAMLSTDFKLGADIAIAAGPVGGTVKAQTADVLAFGRSQGIYGGLSIEGAVIKPRYEWNSSYYGKDIMPIDILFQHSVTNPQADGLRSLLPKRGRNAKPLGAK